MICLSQSAYYSLRQKCGSDILDLELDSLTEREANSESTRNMNMITAFKFRSGSSSTGINRFWLVGFTRVLLGKDRL